MSDLSLEKMKIDERLHNVEIQTARLVAHLESESGSLNRFHLDIIKTVESINDVIKKHDRILTGENGVGLVVKVDRLETSERERTWTLRIVSAATLTMLTKYIIGIIKRN